MTDIDLKKAAKQFAQKFATGSSVTKNAQGLDEIVVQGDVSDEVLEMIEGGVGVLKGVPEKNISIVEEKKKKGGDWWNGKYVVTITWGMFTDTS